MNPSTIEELEEALEELFPGGCIIETDNHGQLIVYTGLVEDEDGELSPFDPDDNEDYEELPEEEDEDTED